MPEERRGPRTRRYEDTLIEVIAAKLDQHIIQCSTDKAILHEELKEMRAESAARFGRLYAGAGSIGLLLLSAIVASYLSAHGFSVGSGG